MQGAAAISGLGLDDLELRALALPGINAEACASGVVLRHGRFDTFPLCLGIGLEDCPPAGSIAGAADGTVGVEPHPHR